MAHPPLSAGVDLPAWKTAVAVGSAVMLALVFIIAGGWKVTDPFGSAARLAQAKVPGALSLPGTVSLGSIELFTAALLLVPRLRRWGSILTAALYVFFMVWVGYYYNDLRGAECSCFPWLKRTVGPGFFIGDGVALALAGLAAWWSRPSSGLRTASMILGAVAVFAGVSYGVAMTQNSGTKAPEFATVDGKQTSLSAGKILLFFFDPECLHCDAAAKRMAKWNWKDTRVISIPTRMPQFANEFLQTTKLKAGISPDNQMLKQTFPFGDPPFGVALENGRQKAALAIFDESQPEKQLREMGYIE